MPAILALDQGTTSSRAIVFDRSGAPLAVAQRELGQHFPEPGWVEHDAVEIWEAQREVAREAVEKAGTEISAVGITNQRETVVVWERATGKPVHRAVVWQDRRTADACAELRAAGHGPDVTAKTGLLLDPYFSATKIAWILDHVPGARERAEAGELACGTVDTWLLWNLTAGAVHATDATNASRTLLYDIHFGTWDDGLLALFRVPRALLPEVRPTSGTFAESTEFGPVTAMAGDQHAALFGQACHAPGMAKNTYGTGCFLLINTGEKPVASQNKLLTTIAWQIGEKTTYALEGSVFIGGAAVQWLRDGLGAISSSSEVDALTRTVENSGGVVFVPAFTGIGAPYWNASARGSLFGMTRGTTTGHIARATLESIAYQSHDVLRAMEQDSGIPLAELRADGGAAQNDTLMQFQADLLGTPVTRASRVETTALGAAYFAGPATGFWESQEEIAARWSSDRTFAPGGNSPVHLDAWRRAVRATLDWADSP